MIGTTFFRAVRRWHDSARIRHQLETLDDRQLADIGLSRSDIDAVALGRFDRPRHAEGQGGWVVGDTKIRGGTHHVIRTLERRLSPVESP